MSRPRPAEPPPPACYAMVQPGLEDVAADEIARDLGGDVRKTARGFVVFRLPRIDPDILRLRTVEDVFLLAWGTDRLSYRAADLKQIQLWARGADWDQLLKLHHAIRPKPRGRPTYHLVAQMTGTHGYRRIDAREALAKGLEGVFPASWRPAEENAAVEVWLTIQGVQAVCGLRLSDRTMRHRDSYKREHLPASLRPSIAAAMVRLAGAGPGQVVLDPMCGAGTILAEQLELARQRKAGFVAVRGGDLDRNATEAALVNLRRLGPTLLARWDATRLPLARHSVDRVVCNPPFGKQLGEPAEIGPLYRRALAECDRVLRPGGRAVLLAAEQPLLQTAARSVGWRPERQLRIQVLGQPATLSVWHKPAESDSIPGGKDER